MILCDSSHLIFRNMHMNHDKVFTDEGGETLKLNSGFFVHLIVANYSSFARDFGFSRSNRFVIAVDARPSWRAQYYEDNSKDFVEYRGQRYKGKREKDAKIPWNDIFDAYHDTLDVLSKYSDYRVVKAEGAEADDVIAVLAEEAAKSEEVWILSSDKDFKQLHSDRIHLYDTVKKRYVDDLDGDVYLKTHILRGDSSDNILPAKRGIGEKTALKLLPRLDEVLQTDPAFRARYEFNENLISFAKIPDWVRKNVVKEFFDAEAGSYNYAKLMQFCLKHQLAKISETLPQCFSAADRDVKTKLNRFHSDAKKDKEAAAATLENFF